ncbi:MAG TPA: hypothetical protein PLE28_02970 [bacterium]|jgi:dolichol kinase|nr:hypothetical protein [bacterium]
MKLAQKKNIEWQKVDNIDRKVIHMISAIIICCFPYVLSLYHIVLLSILFAFIFLIAKIFNFLPIINKVNRITLGEVFYPLGVMLSAIVFIPQGEIRAWQFGILVLGFSDAIANISGGLFGRFKFKLINNTKSLEGSSAFFLTTLILFILTKGQFNSVYFNFYLLASLFLTFIELVFFFGLDNLFLPIMGSYLFSLI